MQIIHDVPLRGSDYVKDGVLHVGSTGGGVLIESENDLDNLPEYAPGTLAHTAGWGNIWEADADGEWVPVSGGE